MTQIERDKKIVLILRTIQKLYHEAIEMKFKEQEVFILTCLSEIIKDENLFFLKDACDSILNKYNYYYPHDSTLIRETKKLLRFPINLLPDDDFDMDMFVFKWYDSLISGFFDKIKSFNLERREEVIIENLERGIHNTLVNNPNFKGHNPFYKRNYLLFDKKLNLELLDNDFNCYIEFFECEE